MSDVVITGTGLITAAGMSANRLLDAMLAHEDCFASQVGSALEAGAQEVWPISAVAWSEIGWPEGREWADNRKYASAVSQAAVAVAQQAIATAGVHDDPLRVGCVMAVTSGSEEVVSTTQRLALKAETDPRPLPTLLFDEVPDYTYIRGIASQIGQFVAMACGARGSNVAVYGEAGAAGLSALALALRLIESGELDRAIVVGVAPPMSLEALAATEQREPLAAQARPDGGPFDSNRAGPMPAQGAVALVIERALHARERGTRALAALRACEVITAAARAEALDVARHLAFDRTIYRPDVWWASGMGSVRLDEEECNVLGKVIQAPVTTTKGTIGTAFECSALIDLVTAVAALGRNVIPPVSRLLRPDPALGAIDFVVGQAREVPAARVALVTGMSHGEGTTAGAAILERTDDSE